VAALCENQKPQRAVCDYTAQSIQNSWSHHIIILPEKKPEIRTTKQLEKRNQLISIQLLSTQYIVANCNVSVKFFNCIRTSL